MFLQGKKKKVQMLVSTCRQQRQKVTYRYPKIYFSPAAKYLYFVTFHLWQTL